MSTQLKKLCPILPFKNSMNIGLTSQNLITPDELSRIFKISKPSVYRLVDNRILPFYKVGGSLRFSISDINEYLSNVKVEPIQKQYEYIQKK